MTQDPTGITPDSSQEWLYPLLPAIYHIRDEAQGQPLRVLLNLIEQELRRVEGDIDNLYDNWFIETCDEWVVPYIGDLLSVRELNAASPRTYGQERRAYIANTLTYRQRKGTTPVLEQLARDITGWRSRAVEALPLLATVQNLNHIRAQNVTADLRRDRRPERIGTPFEQRVAYTAEVRRAAGDRSTYKPTSLTLFLWRLQNYPIDSNQPGTARRLRGPDSTSRGRYYSFNPVGLRTPLFNQPQTETDFTSLAQEIHVPAVLTRALLGEELKTRLDRVRRRQPPDPEGYLGEQPVLQIWEIRRDQRRRVKPEEMLVYDLLWEANPNWQAPVSETFDFIPTGSSDSRPPEVAVQTRIALDPETGRLACLTEVPPDRIEVSYSYGFSGDVGGGPYDRREFGNDALQAGEDLSAPTVAQMRWQVDLGAAHSARLLQAALQEWNDHAQTWQNCADQTAIPIAHLVVNPSGDVELLDPEDDPSGVEIRPQFAPGIIRRMTVSGKPGQSWATIAPGQAVDGAGQIINLRIRYEINLMEHPGLTVLVLISYRTSGWDPRWQIDVVPQEAGNRYPEATHIRLARLVINDRGDLTRLDNSVRTPFSPGIVRGLSLTLPDPATPQVAIAPGLAINRHGKLLPLPQPQTFNLTPFQATTPQIAVLFLKDEGGRRKDESEALPTLPPTSGREAGRGMRNAVPTTSNQPPTTNHQPPTLAAIRHVEAGILLLRGNASLKAEPTVLIPAGKAFWMVAANGDRPHLRGDLTVQGIATPGSDPGEFRLEGVLLEGRLTVLPGNLQEVAIAHSTLVPRSGGLVVQQVEPAPEETEAEEDTALMALILYCFALIQRFVRLGFGQNGLSHWERVDRLWQLAVVQVRSAFDALCETVQRWRVPPPPECLTRETDLVCEDEEDKTPARVEDNSDLTVKIQRSICGAIALTDTVPNLVLVDSIIDAGSQRAGVDAIRAPGTSADIQATTVLGSTTLRSLEASDSLFTDTVTTLRRQVGCLRFCYVPAGSQTPRRYRCQPDLVLSSQIKTLPAPISALSVDPDTGAIAAATAGRGVFRFLTQPQGWLPLNEGLSNPYVTALVAYNQQGTGILLSDGTATVTGRYTRFNQELQAGDQITIADQTRTVLTVLSNERLQLDAPLPPPVGIDTPLTFSINRLMVGGTGGSLFRTNPFSRQGSGTLRTASLTSTTVLGNGTFFSRELVVGDGISVAGQTRTVLAIASDTRLEVSAAFSQGLPNEQPFQIVGTRWTPVSAFPARTDVTRLTDYRDTLSGTVSASGTQVTGEGTRFNAELIRGDRVSLDGQIRTVAGVKSDTQLTLDRALETEPSPATPMQINRILASTAGEGLFRSTDGGNTWTTINTGLENLDVRAIALHPIDRSLWLGTNGGGVFRSTDGGNTWSGGNASSLTNPCITSLTINPLSGTLVVGTEGGLFVSSDNGQRWSRPNATLQTIQAGSGRITSQGIRVTGHNSLFAEELAVGDILLVEGQARTVRAIVSRTLVQIDAPFQPEISGEQPFQILSRRPDSLLTRLNVTVLLSCVEAGMGWLTSRDTTVTGQGTQFTTDLVVGMNLTLAGQTRRIVAIASDTQLEVETAFDADFTEPTPYRLAPLLAGTTGGSIFRSIDDGTTWQPISVGLSDTEITTLVRWVAPDGNALLLAGTQVGSVFRTLEGGEVPQPTMQSSEAIDIPPPIASEGLRDRWVSLNAGLNRVDETLLLLNQIQPSFTATDYGQPGYAQLSLACPVELRTGAEDGSEMGVFSHLKQPQREANLRTSLEEYLRFGLEANLIFVT